MIDPIRYELTVTRHHGRRTGASSDASASAGEVTSPMPGRVVRVMAETDEDVEAVREYKEKHVFMTAA